MKLCVPIQEKTQKMALKRLSEVKNKADLVEIWLDHIKDLDLKELISNTPLPVICACKKPIEGGKFNGSYAEIAEMLLLAAKCGAEYVDLPLAGFGVRSSEFLEILSKLQPTNYNLQTIISYHNFKKTPSQQILLKKAKEMRKLGADIVKIAVTARSMEDTFSIISLAQILQSEKIPHILIAMGKKGILSRVLTPYLGGTIMFAPLSSKKSSASGQLTVKELREAWGLIR